MIITHTHTDTDGWSRKRGRRNRRRKKYIYSFERMSSPLLNRLYHTQKTTTYHFIQIVAAKTLYTLPPFQNYSTQQHTVKSLLTSLISIDINRASFPFSSNVLLGVERKLITQPSSYLETQLCYSPVFLSSRFISHPNLLFKK